MSEKMRPIDWAAREDFRTRLDTNFAVSANAGSGKTTSISQRLAAMARSTQAAKMLANTAVVTFTKKAAQQIGQRAREELLKQLSEGSRESGSPDHSTHAPNSLAALNHLERAFFGTIHSFCLLLAKRYGQTSGINQNPEVADETSEEAYWEEFLEQDKMTFTALAPAQVQGFLRHVPLDDIFELARGLTDDLATHFLKRAPAGATPEPDRVALTAMGMAKVQARSAEKFRKNQATAEEWLRRFREEKTFLPFEAPDGTAGGIVELYEQFFAPVKRWLASAGAVLAAELSGRYRAWRQDRGVQTYADQVEAAVDILKKPAVLEEIRKDGWRVILDEAQDTDPQQFAVLVEITRPKAAKIGEWPGAGVGPRAGHFCMVGDGQQAIYGSRADISNFMRHVDAFRRGDGGEVLSFQVTFRTPRTVIDFLNSGFPEAFSEGNDFNYALSPEGVRTEKLKQVPYMPLLPRPQDIAGGVARLPLQVGGETRKVDAWMAEEARQLATFFKAHGPAGVGAKKWGDVCMIAPRNKWLITVRKAFEASGLKIALQMRKNRNGDNPVYAWMTALLAAVCDHDNAFEWFGVLREIFAVSDAVLVAELGDAEADGERGWNWRRPEEHMDATLRRALETLRPFADIACVPETAMMTLGKFAEDLAHACGLAEKARLLDPSGGLEGELERLLAEAAEMSLEGATPREWLRHLRDGLDKGRPAGKPEDDAINLLTSHSSKGLEWPVIIPLGLWRKQSKLNESGLRLVGDSVENNNTGDGAATGGARVYFDGATMGKTLRASRDNEYKREQLRLLYVTLTRAKQHLVIPWGEGFGTKGQRGAGVSFAEIWKRADLFEALRECCGVEATAGVEATVPVARFGESRKSDGGRRCYLGEALAPLPKRLLPHQLAHAPVIDETRAAAISRDEEITVDFRQPAESDEAIEYGLWWHETMESLPWNADDAELGEYFEKAALHAEALRAGVRGREELARLFASDALRELREGRWTREAELPVFAPESETGDAWIDGIMDLVIHDAAANEARVTDWKTNRRRVGESDENLLARLSEEYAPQLRAYGRSVGLFFPGAKVRMFVYSSAAGKAVEIV